MKGFDLSKFKKIHEDKDWATLIHKDGHSLRIAKAPLSPIQRKQLEHLQKHEDQKYAKGGRAHYDEGTSDVEPTDQNSSQQPSPLQSIMNDTNAQSDQSQTQSEAPSNQQSPAQSSAQSSPQQQPLNTEVPNSGLEQEEMAQEKKGQAEASQSNAIAEAEKQAVANINQGKSANQIYQDDVQKDQALRDAYASKKLNPDLYWTGDQEAGIEGHSKISAGIGVLLSSLGQGIGMGRVSSNAGLDAIQQGINREIDRQKNSQEQGYNLYKMNQAAYGNEQTANLATQNQLLLGVQHKIAQATAQTQGPIAIQNGKIGAAKIQQIIDMNNIKKSILQSNSPQDFPNPEDKVNAMLRMGMIQPDTAVKLAEEIKNRRDLVIALPKILNAHDIAAKDVRPLTGGMGTSLKAFSPLIPFIGHQDTPGQKAFEAEINPTVKESEGSARATAFKSIKDTLEPQLGDSDQAIKMQRASIPDYLASHAAEPLSRMYGIDLDQYPQTNLKGSPVAPQIKMSGGVKYIRGANGKAVPVK